MGNETETESTTVDKSGKTDKLTVCTLANTNEKPIIYDENAYRFLINVYVKGKEEYEVKQGSETERKEVDVLAVDENESCVIIKAYEVKEKDKYLKFKNEMLKKSKEELTAHGEKEIQESETVEEK